MTFSTEVATVSCTPSFSLTSHCIVGRTHLGPQIVEMLATSRVSSFLNSEKINSGKSEPTSRLLWLSKELYAEML